MIIAFFFLHITHCDCLNTGRNVQALQVNEQMDTQKMIDFSVVSIFGELGVLMATYVRAAAGGTSR